VKAYFVVLSLVALGLVGCGGGGGGADAPTTAQASGRSGQTSHSPSGATQTPLSPRVAAAARGAGRHACRGMTPLEAAHRFKASARRAGVRKRFAELVTEPTPATESSAGYPQLVASLYATTVPAPGREQAAAGCAEELAVSSRDGGAASKRTGQEGLPVSGSQEQKGSN
jgi:hypothetical protein